MATLFFVYLLHYKKVSSFCNRLKPMNNSSGFFCAL